MDNLLVLAADALNFILRLDENLSTNLATISKQRIGIEITDLNCKVALSFSENGIILSKAAATEQVDLTIKGSLLSLVSFVVTQDLALAKQVNLKFIGDVETANQLQKFIQGINIDWQEYLAKYLGDVAAVAICKFANSSKAKFAKVLTDVLQMSAEFLIEESKQVPHNQEIADFMNQIDELVARLNRVESRYQQLELLSS